MARDLPDSPRIRNLLASKGRPYHWDSKTRPVKRGYGAHEVNQHCVRNERWQKVRLSMQGKYTWEKLATLQIWWDTNFEAANKPGLTQAEKSLIERSTEIQVGNYLGALRRGGQLNDDNWVRKER